MRCAPLLPSCTPPPSPAPSDRRQLITAHGSPSRSDHHPGVRLNLGGLFGELNFERSSAVRLHRPHRRFLLCLSTLCRTGTGTGCSRGSGPRPAGGQCRPGSGALPCRMPTAGYRKSSVTSRSFSPAAGSTTAPTTASRAARSIRLSRPETWRSADGSAIARWSVNSRGNTDARTWQGGKTTADVAQLPPPRRHLDFFLQPHSRRPSQALMKDPTVDTRIRSTPERLRRERR